MWKKFNTAESRQEWASRHPAYVGANIVAFQQTFKETEPPDWTKEWIVWDWGIRAKDRVDFAKMVQADNCQV